MPLINHCNGGGGTPQLCGQVENFEVVNLGNNSLKLTWTAPNPDEDNSFVGARIVRKTGSAPTSINDGTVVYEGTALSYTDTGLTYGTTYYYRAFAYNAKKKYQTEYRVISITAAVAIQPNFADNTWDAIIEACHSGNVPGTWVAGDNKTMTIDGKSYQVDIVGKNHDTYTAGGIAPLTFGLHDCYGTKYPMNSSNISTNSTGWDSSKMRTETLPAIITKMPVNIQNGIRPVNKLTATSGSSSAIKTASDKLFIFSEMEVYGSATKSYSGEGKQYDYYKAGNSKVKKLGGTASWWWLRSPNKGSAISFCAVHTSGSINTDGSDDSIGVCFGFCF